MAQYDNNWEVWNNLGRRLEKSKIVVLCHHSPTFSFDYVTDTLYPGTLIPVNAVSETYTCVLVRIP